MSCLWKRMARCTRVKPASNADGRLRIRTSSAVSWRAISPLDDLYASTAARSPSTTPDESMRYIWVGWLPLSQLFEVAVWISDSIPVRSIGPIDISPEDSDAALEINDFILWCRKADQKCSLVAEPTRQNLSVCIKPCTCKPSPTGLVMKIKVWYQLISKDSASHRSKTCQSNSEPEGVPKVMCTQSPSWSFT